MFCPNCGTEVKAEAVYCPHCGKKLAVFDTTVSAGKVCGQPKSRKNSSAGENGGKHHIFGNRRLYWIAAGAAAAVLIGLAAHILYRPTIHMDDYLVLRSEGYDTIGTATVTVDKDAFLEDYAKRLHANKRVVSKLDSDASTRAGILNLLKEARDSETDKSGQKITDLFTGILYGYQDITWDHVCNGDTITFSWSIGEQAVDALEEIYHCRISLEDKDFTVSGLKPVGKYDAFQNYSLRYDGTAPYGEIAGMVYSQTDDQGRETGYGADKSYDLSNGDKITVTASSDDEKDAETYGSIVSPKTKVYTVEGLDAYLDSGDEMSEQEWNDAIAEGQDKVTDLMVNENGVSEDILGVESAGYYFYHLSDPQWIGNTHQIYNGIYFLYKITITPSDISPYFVLYSCSNVIRKADGSLRIGEKDIIDSFWYLSDFYSKYDVRSNEFFESEDHVDKNSDDTLNYAPTGPNYESEWWDPTGAKDVDETLASAVEDQIAAQYGLVQNTDMESPYWYQDMLYTGNYSGEDGVFAWELADLDDDEQNELIVFFRQSDVHGYTDARNCYLEDTHGWRFAFSVYEYRNGDVLQTEEKDICRFNWPTDESMLYMTFQLDYPEYFGLSVALKDTVYGKEIVVMEYTDVLGANHGQSDGPIKIEGYYYDGKIHKTGYFENAPYYVEADSCNGEADTSGVSAIGVQPEDIDLDKLVFWSEDMQGDCCFDSLEQMIDCQPVFHLYRTSNLDESGKDRWDINLPENNQDIDISQYKEALHTELCSGKAAK